MHRFGVLGISLMALATMAAVALGLAATLAPPAMAVPFTSPDGLWTWSRPLPHGYPANSISAPAPGELFVASSVSDFLTTTGSVSDLLATTDGGASWAWSRTSAVSGFATPDGVQFVSPTEGWAWGGDTTGKDEMLLHTTDEGATWQSRLTIPAPQEGSPMVRFAGPLSGWVVTGDVNFALYATSDGGQAWSGPLTVPDGDGNLFAALAPQGAGKAAVFETVYSAGYANGDIVGTSVVRTADGGATWLAPTMLKGDEIVDATFSSATVGWATGASWLWHTTDGGASWNRVHRAPAYGTVTTTGNNVWVISPLASASGSSWALHSADGGKTWRELPGLSGNHITFSTPLDGWIAAGATYLYTTNGGKTWHRVTPASRPGVNSLAAVAGETVWGAAGRVIKSSDGGGHWRHTTKRQVIAVAAVSARQAWAVGRKGLVLHTSDGGHHWTVQPTGVAVSLHVVFFVDARHGWASGGNTLLRTVDGGRHWTHRRTAIAGSVSHLDFADAGHGIALLSAASRPFGFLVTSNGGRTWAMKHLPVSTDLPTAAIMLDSSHALITAWPGTADVPHSWTSADSGKTWQRGADLPGADLPNLDRYVSIARSGSLLCAVSSFGGVATSLNDGATWSYDDTPAGYGMSSVQFVGGDTLMIAGGLGVLTRNLTTAPLP